MNKKHISIAFDRHLIMDYGNREFTKGKIYAFSFSPEENRYTGINDSGDRHQMGWDLLLEYGHEEQGFISLDY